jgi:hypothetical protein
MPGATLVPSRASQRKAACGACGRTVVYVEGEDGKPFPLESEVITVALYPTPSRGVVKRIEARRAHAEVCFRYQNDDARAEQQQRVRRALGGVKAPKAKR